MNKEMRDAYIEFSEDDGWMRKIWGWPNFGLHKFWHDCPHAQLNLYFIVFYWSTQWTNMPKDYWDKKQVDNMTSNVYTNNVVIEEFTAENIDRMDPYEDLALLSREQLMGQCLRYRRYLDVLEQWQLDAFEVSPNIDLDIERLRAIRMREGIEKTYESY